MAIRRKTKNIKSSMSIELFIPDSELIHALKNLPIKGRTSVYKKASKRAAVAMRTRSTKIAIKTLNLKAPAIKKSMTWSTPWNREIKDYDGDPMPTAKSVVGTRASIMFWIVGRPVPMAADPSVFSYSYEAKWKGQNSKPKRFGATHNGFVVTKILKSSGWRRIKGKSGGSRIFIAKSPKHPQGRSFGGGSGKTWRGVYERKEGVARHPLRKLPGALSVMQFLKNTLPKKEVLERGMEVLVSTLKHGVDHYLNSRLKSGVRRAVRNGTWVGTK